MTAQQEGYWLKDAARFREKVAKALAVAFHTVLSACTAKTRPARTHIQEHTYTWGGFGLISAASFVHSVFTGLLVSGILLLVFEWKAGD